MPNRDERAAFIARMLDEFEARSDAAGQRTVKEMWDEWFATMLRTTREAGLRTVRYYLDMDVPFEGGSFRLSELQAVQVVRERILAWLARLATVPKRRGKGLLAVGFQHQIRIAVNQFFQWHVEHGGLKENPFKGIPWTTRPGKRVGYFATAEDMNDFLAGLPPIARDMLTVAAQSGGLRRTEMRLLRQASIDHETKEAMVRRKGGKIWRVMLTDESYRIVCKWSAVSPGEFVFANPRSLTGEAIPQGTWQSWVKRARKRYGKTLMGEQPTAHHMRHTSIMAQIQAGQDLGHIAEQHGLESAKQVIELYGALRGPARNSYRDRMEQSPLVKKVR
jgi:integrase